MSRKSKPGPTQVETSFRVVPGLYVVGSLERGVTIYSQQVRAHNLAWALWEIHRSKKRRVGKIAVVGGGIAGLTMAACLLSLFEKEENVAITLFEQSWDLCPLQQGADVRWVHPQIYNWPRQGSRAPSASLPVLDWSEGRASDVARTVLREFEKFYSAFARRDGLMSIYLGLQHFQIDERELEISWIAHNTSRADEFFQLARPEGSSAKFDTIILAAGFGTETRLAGFPTEPYWRNEQLGQPTLDGAQRRFLISGYGDGALVDLCRLTIERFRQDTIVYELFRDELDEVEEYFSKTTFGTGSNRNVFELLQASEGTVLRNAKLRLRDRLRKDTQVTLHLRGRNSTATNFSYIFGSQSSFLHRVITFLLYRCGAFALDFGELDQAVARHQVDQKSVLCRYGANTVEHLGSLFVRPKPVSRRFEKMKVKQAQSPERLWVPGTFPHYSKQ